MNEQIAATTRIVEEIVARTQESLEEFVKIGQQQADKAGTTLKTNFDEVNEVGRKNLDAVVESSKVLTRGIEDAGQAAVAFTKQSSEASLEVLRKLSTATTLAEAAEIQQTFVKERTAALVAESERVSALVASVARDAFAPINERVTVAVTRLTQAA